MIYAGIIKRIRDKAPLFQQRVGGTADFIVKSNEDADIAMPHAWVVPLSETADPSSNMGRPQRVSERFGVIVCVTNALGRDDGLGLIASDALRAIRQSLFNSLLGWEPLPYYDTVSYVGARHLSMNRARIFHQYDFSVAYPVDVDGEPDACVPLREAYRRIGITGQPRPPGTEGMELWFPEPGAPAP